MYMHIHIYMYTPRLGYHVDALLSCTASSFIDYYNIAAVFGPLLGSFRGVGEDGSLGPRFSAPLLFCLLAPLVPPSGPFPVSFPP